MYSAEMRRCLMSSFENCSWYDNEELNLKVQSKLKCKDVHISILVNKNLLKLNFYSFNNLFHFFPRVGIHDHLVKHPVFSWSQSLVPGPMFLIDMTAWIENLVSSVRQFVVQKIASCLDSVTKVSWWNPSQRIEPILDIHMLEKNAGSIQEQKIILDHPSSYY